MSNKLISQMGLPPSIANIFAARNILTAKDALSLPEFELMTLLDVALHEVRSAVASISEAACPPYQTLCLKLSLIAALPACYGGLNGRVIYIDTESKFSSRRMIEIGENSFPHIFRSEGMAREMAGRIVVLRPSSLSELTDSLQQMKLTLIQHEVKLLVIDSMAALVSGENERAKTGSWQNSLRWPLPFLKSLAEFSRIPIVVTNQVRSYSSDEACHYLFQGKKKDIPRNTERLESHLSAALGIQWAHAVTIRLIFEAHSGHRFIKVAKSPMSPPLAFPFIVDSSGISLVSDEAIEVMGLEISTIRCQGHSILDS